MANDNLVRAESLILVVAAVWCLMAYTIRVLRRRRPDLEIWRPVMTGLGLRLAAIAAVNATGISSQLRGGDESTFLAYARLVAASPWGRGYLPHGKYQLHTILFGAQIKLFNLNATSLRVTQVGLAMLGIILIVAAVHDLAGPRAARLAAWILALEPANVFFNSELHKEPIMVLASGLVVFGGTKLWRRLDLNGVLLCALGGVIAVETRSYAGWFLVSASLLLALSAALRHIGTPLRSLPIVYAVALTVFLVTPTLVSISSNKSLQRLQQGQNYTTVTQAQNSPGGANSDNLALEKVNFSTRGAVLRNLPQRMFDVIFRPYPWQLANTSQRLGALGSLVALAGLLALVRYALRLGRRAFALTAPLLYPLFFLLIAYSLAAGNAGTGFRYRSHLVLLGAAMLAIVREEWLAAQLGDEISGEAVLQRPHTPLVAA